jgi:hypothetical protein
MVVNFVSKDSITFVLDMGSKDSSLHLTLHSRNGVVEKRNHTITEMVRCMLYKRCVPNRFWAEAMFTTIYLWHRSPTMVVKKKTLEEAWFGRKPKVSQLKVF